MKRTTATPEIFDAWTEDRDAPVALFQRRIMQAVEGEDAVVFPPTYAGGGYSIDTLSDGTRVVQIDSVGSQANRMEPIFKASTMGRPDNPFAKLVPQISIVLDNGKAVSVLDAGHRLGDAIVRASELAQEAESAYSTFLADGDADALARLGPTSIVFGSWDSRGTQAKLPRIVQSVVRAWNVDPLNRRATYIPPVDYTDESILGEHVGDSAEKDARSGLGFLHAPSEAPGGVKVNGEIRREVTVNLIALRALGGTDGPALRRYILGLALVAATEPLDGFFRQGCLLTPSPDHESVWEVVHRSGKREQIEMPADKVADYAAARARAFGVAPDRTVRFDKKAAKEMIADEKKGEKKGKKKK
jgi:CRISPR-associated protein Csb1